MDFVACDECGCFPARRERHLDSGKRMDDGLYKQVSKSGLWTECGRVACYYWYYFPKEEVPWSEENRRQIEFDWRVKRFIKRLLLIR